jgi:thioredoxin 1
VCSSDLFICLTLLIPGRALLFGMETKQVPVKGKVTMVDLGAASCIPCKMMAPILEKLEKQYRGKAAIVFIDLRYDREAAQRFGVRAIPTQIFFDKNGKEAFRHIGFMSEEAIVAHLQSMGVK